MTKGKLAAKFIWTLVIVLVCAGLFIISAVVWDISFLGNSAASVWGDGTTNAGHALFVLYRPVTDVIIKGLFNPAFITGMFSATFWSGIAASPLAFINYITIFLFFAVLVFYVIEFIVNLVRVFTHHKAALLWNILWYAILSFVLMYIIALIHLALYGTNSGDFMALNWQNGPFFNYLAVTLFQRTGTPAVGNDYLNFASMKDNGLTFMQVIGGWVMLVCFWLFMIFALVGLIKAWVLIGRCIAYTKAHKYDYIIKREMKAKAKYYKDHGFENGKEKVAKPEDQYAGLPYPCSNPAYPYGGNMVQTGNNAPLIVQYLNSDGRMQDQGILNTRQPAIQVTNPQQGLTREDLKLAIMEVLNAQKDPQVVVNQPVAAPAAPAKEDDYYQDYEVLTEDDLAALIARAVETKEKEEALTREDVKKIIAEELDDNCECCHCCDVDEACGDACEEEAPAKASALPPIIVSIPTKIEEGEEPEVEEEEVEEERINEDDLRELVKAQILEALKEVKVNTEIKEVKETKVVKAEPKAAPAKPAEKPAPKAEPAKAAPAKAEEKPAPAKVVKAPAKPVAAPKKAAPIKQPQVRGREEMLDKEESEKKSFMERIAGADDDIKKGYNELKNLLVGYGLKDRISTTGDTFRAHKVTYCKITMGSTYLKLYMALDPKAYAKSALPIDDASGKEAYKDIPLVFRVKSDLSVRRAHDLITDMMRDAGMTLAEPLPEVDYVAEIKKELRKAARAAKAQAAK